LLILHNRFNKCFDLLAIYLYFVQQQTSTTHFFVRFNKGFKLYKDFDVAKTFGMSEFPERYFCFKETRVYERRLLRYYYCYLLPVGFTFISSLTKPLCTLFTSYNKLHFPFLSSCDISWWKHFVMTSPKSKHLYQSNHTLKLFTIFFTELGRIHPILNSNLNSSYKCVTDLLYTKLYWLYWHIYHN